MGQGWDGATPGHHEWRSAAWDRERAESHEKAGLLSGPG